MKFKILESVFDSFKFDGDTYFVYLNPTSQELNSKEDTKNNRGIVDPEGNFYMEAKWKNEGQEFSSVLHNNLLYFLSTKMHIFKELNSVLWWEEDYFTYGVCVERNHAGFDFYLSYSYRDELLESSKNLLKIKKIFKKAKEKNPHLKFVAVKNS